MSNKTKEEIRQILEDLDNEDINDDEDFSDDGEYGDDPTYNTIESEENSDESENNFDFSVNVNEETTVTETNVNEDSVSDANVSEDENETEWVENLKPLPSFTFDKNFSGIKIHISENSTPIEIFKQIFNDKIISKIVDSANNYGEKLNANAGPSTRNTRFLHFNKIEGDEMTKFLALCLLQGQVKTPKIRHLFSNDALYFHPIFKYTMSGRRFEQILRCFNCSPESEDDTKLRKIRPLLSLFIESFQNALYPEKELSLDESLLLFRGRLSFRQYIKNKKAKYGIKLFELTTSDGYVLNIEIYQGRNEQKDSTISSLVMRMLTNYMNKGHHLFMDNYYNNVGLCNTLLEYKTLCTGTLRNKRKNNPEIVQKKVLRKGEYIWRRNKKVYVSKWRDKRDVLCITTANHPKIVPCKNRFGLEKEKPAEIVIYNQFMSGIDHCDQMTAYYSSPRKTIRWYKKVMFHLLDVAVWNSYYLFKIKTNSRTLSFLEFRNQLIKFYF